MKLDKLQLKKLIKEVIREAEGMMAVRKEADEPSDSPEGGKEGPLPAGDDDAMKHSREAEKHAGETTVKLTVRGVKPGRAYKDFLAKVAYDAKMADLEAIHAEISKGGTTIDSMDIGDLKRAQQQAPAAKATGGKPQIDLTNLSPEEQAQWNDPNTPKDELKRLYRLSKIKPGEKEDEWKALTAKDMEAERAKAQRRKAMLAAGTLEMMPIDPSNPESPQVPKDSSLWTDKEWDMATQGGEAQTAVAASGQKAGQQVYRPSFKKADRKGGRHVFAPINYNRQ